MQQDFARHNNVQQHNFGCKTKREKISFRYISFFVGVKHVLKMHMNIAEVLVHPKFGGRRPDFFVSKQFFWPEFDEPDVKTSLAMIQQQNLVAKRSAEKLHFDAYLFS